MTSNYTHPFELLTPDLILDAVESCGFISDGCILPLNSYENRVYQIGIADKQPLIVKFYRPARWSDEQILEEHAFCHELAQQDLPIVAPLYCTQDESAASTLLFYNKFRFSIFPRRGGHAPELDYADNLLIMGRFLGRMHLLGAKTAFKHRPTIDSQSYGHASVALIREQFIPAELTTAYATLTRDLLSALDEVIQTSGPQKLIRTHSDCHIGNILWRDDAPHFVDFDDARMAPAVQDIWMLLSGDRTQQLQQLGKVIDGYEQFYDFNTKELQLVEVLRTLRILNYNAWLAARWQDPAFPLNFPWFNSQRYWEQHILDLREQFAALAEPPLVV